MAALLKRPFEVFNGDYGNGRAAQTFAGLKEKTTQWQERSGGAAAGRPGRRGEGSAVDWRLDAWLRSTAAEGGTLSWETPEREQQNI